MKANFTLKKVAFIFMILAATLVMNAQTQVNPWHVVVYDNSGKEVASHSIEIISNITVSGDEVDFLLNNGATYPYPITSTFDFEQRVGNGTAIETVAAPMWNVSYTNGTLHFTAPVKSVAIYAMSGVLTNKFNGNSTSIPINLSQGLYIVQADGKATKLLVASNSSGGVSTQSKIVDIMSQPEAVNMVQKSTSTTYGSPTPFRAATAALNQYWIIVNNNDSLPITISDVGTFQFTSAGTVKINYINGNSAEVAYNGTSFNIAQISTGSSNIDWNSTLLYCGANYDADGNVYYSMATTSEFIVYDVMRNTTTQVARSSINDMDKFNNPQKFMSVGSTIEDPIGHIGTLAANGVQPFVGIIYKANILYSDNSYDMAYCCFALTNDRSTLYPVSLFPNGCIIPVAVSEKDGKVILATNFGSHTF